jgi:hypothetical protein
MRYFMRIVGGIGMHEGYLPGYPASHGCIRLPTKMAAIFFEHTPQGTPVEVIGAGSLAVTEEAIPLGEQPIAAAPPPETRAPIEPRRLEIPDRSVVHETCGTGQFIQSDHTPRHPVRGAAARPQAATLAETPAARHHAIFGISGA